MYFYVQLDDDNIVVGIQMSPEKKPSPHVRQVKESEYNESLIGKLYEDGKFIPMLHFAVLDEKNVVIDLQKCPSNKPVPKSFSSFMKIDNEGYGLIGCTWDGKEFIPPAVISNDEIMARMDSIDERLEQLTQLLMGKIT